MAPELPKDRLATTDERGNRVYLYPAAVTGFWKDRRQWVHGALIIFFLILPWIQVNGRQLLLLDVARREFFIFGLHLRAHDTPLLLLLILSFCFLIGLITTLWGRIWCGWACPQTVFIEAFFRRIENLIEGNHRERKLLDESSWTWAKIWRRSLKYSLFFVSSLAITHSFLAYFVGSHALISMVTSPPAENWPSFLVILVTTAVILFDFGWFREQFCLIVCPYGRFQSLMVDSHSLVVGYDSTRGEPRRNLLDPKAPQGDCVDCRRCVQVCPTGIDIRRGLQMECIGCTACIDACDAVMSKTKKPSGLIRYTSQAELSGQKSQKLRARPAVYALLLVTTLVALSVILERKQFLDVTILRASGTPYEILQLDGKPFVVNHFRADFSNQTSDSLILEFSLVPDADVPGATLLMPLNPVALAEGAAGRADFFLRVPASALPSGKKTMRLQLKYKGESRIQEVPLVGPDA